MSIITTIIGFISGGILLTTIGLILAKIFIRKYKTRLKEEIYDLFFHIIKDALIETQQELRRKENRQRKK